MREGKILIQTEPTNRILICKKYSTTSQVECEKEGNAVWELISRYKKLTKKDFICNKYVF